MAESVPRCFGNPAFREIHKNTWLKRMPSDSKRKKERVWVVFCVHDDAEPYLEAYADNKSSVLHKPEWAVALNNTRHVSPTICAQDQDYEFVITLSNDVVRLAAPSWEAMLDWVESLRAKLLELKILMPKENLYSKLPENRGPLLPTRDPTSPLPPPPAVPPALLPGIEPNERTGSVANSPNITRRHAALQRGLSLPETSMSIEISTGNITIVQVQNTQPNVFTFEPSTETQATNLNSNSSYERLFELSGAGPSSSSNGLNHGPISASSSSSSNSNGSNTSNPAIVSSSYPSNAYLSSFSSSTSFPLSTSFPSKPSFSANTSTTSNTSNTSTTSFMSNTSTTSFTSTTSITSNTSFPANLQFAASNSNSANPSHPVNSNSSTGLSSGASIPAVRTNQAPSSVNHALGTRARTVVNITRPPQPSSEPFLTLRDQQVLQLQREMEHPGGVRLQLRKRDCVNSLALADAFNSVWICGWKQKENPTLHNALHIGDRVLSVDGCLVKNAADAQRALRASNALFIHLVVRRVPHGQVFALHRDVEGQSLGLSQEGGTAVVSNVDADGLAARCGLSLRARTCDGLSLTNWVLTEINGRPLNLFFKENEIRDRLNCVGRDISLLVQPHDLVKQLKKQLKNVKNYKEYVLQ